MPTPKDIHQQEKLLGAYRETLGHYLFQRAQLGRQYAPPGVTAGINETRADIARVKRILRSWNVEVEDLPDDDESFDQGKPIEQAVNRQLEVPVPPETQTPKPQISNLRAMEPEPVKTQPDNTNEIIFFEDKPAAILITDKRVILRRNTFSTNDLVSVSMFEKKRSIIPLIITSFGVFLIYGISNAGAVTSDVFGFSILWVIVLIAVAIFTFTRKYSIRLESKSEYTYVNIRYGKLNYAEKIVDAISKAINGRIV